MIFLSQHVVERKPVRRVFSVADRRPASERHE
jgi:hypothetical protein